MTEEIVNKICKDLDIPIPKVIAENTSAFPYYFVMTFIPGKDLGLVYSSLSRDEKKAIAKSLINYQKEIKKLPVANVFGSLNSLDYAEYLKEEMNLNPSQEKAVKFYILVFCIIFMSEKGASFNQSEAAPVTEQEKNLLVKIFERYYEELKAVADDKTL